MISAKPASKLALASALLQSSGKPVRAVPEAKKGRLVILPNKCTGCGTCELACSFVHATAERLGRTRIRITDVGPERHVQLTCLQCVDAACTQVCPTEALVRSQETGAVEVNERRCIGCRSCEAACPFGHIHFDQVSSVPVKCDLCQGAPACAAFCPYDALEIR